MATVTRPGWFTRATTCTRHLAESLDGPVTRADAQQWAGARSIADMGALTARWLEGDLVTAPHYRGRPDEETLPLIPTLAAANRAGFFTDCSQPATPLTPGWDGRRWQQRAAVEGWVEWPDAQRLADLVDEHAGQLVMTAGQVGRRRDGYRAIPVTEAGGHPCTWFGCRPSRREVRGIWDVCAPEVLDAMCTTAAYVSIVDLAWGHYARLWQLLDKFAAERAEGR